MKIFSSILFLIFTTIILITSCMPSKNVSEVPPALDSKNMDTTIKPGESFFDYANGGWMKKNIIPPDRSRFGAFDELQEMNFKQVKDILETSAATKNAAKGSLEQLIGDFYSSGMDSAKIEKDGITPLKPELDLINNLTDIKSLQKEIAHLHLFGVSPLFSFYSGQDEKNSTSIIANLFQGGLGLHDRDYYLG